MNKILIDTNILVYSVDQDSIYFNSAQKLIYNTEYNLFTTSKNISEFLSVITKAKRYSFSMEEALTLVDDFSKIFKIIYPTKNSNNIFFELLRKYKPAGLQIHDYEIAAISLSKDISKIATFNEKDFKDIDEIKLLPLYS